MTTLQESPDDAPAVPRTVARALDLLEIVIGSGATTLTAAAREAGLTPTSALRHLRALEARGYLSRDGSGRYGVGPTMLLLSSGIWQADPVGRLTGAARPVLDDLARTTGETCYLAIVNGGRATYVACAESDRAIRHVGWVGRTVPVRGTAVGAALDRPGTTAVRSGAVEPDITAVSRALPPIGDLRAALSVLGPSQRLDGDAIAAVSAQLDRAVARLTFPTPTGPGGTTDPSRTTDPTSTTDQTRTTDPTDRTSTTGQAGPVGTTDQGGTKEQP